MTSSKPDRSAGAAVRWMRGRGSAVALLVVTAHAGAALAQQSGPTAVLGGFTRSNGPINIQADQLTVNDARKIAVYKGNVVAVQGDNTLRTVELEVHYSGGSEKGKGGKSAGAGGEESQQIKRIVAKEKVVMVSAAQGKEQQSATSDRADYDVVGQMVTLSGGVFIRQGENVICGSEVTMNLKTSEYAVKTDPSATPNPQCGTGGRVTSVFHPQQKDQGAKAGAAPAPAPAAAPAEKAKRAPSQPSTSSWGSTTSR